MATRTVTYRVEKKKGDIYDIISKIPKHIRNVPRIGQKGKYFDIDVKTDDANEFEEALTEWETRKKIEKLERLD